MTENKRFTFDNDSLLKDGEFWLDGSVATLCNSEEICQELNKLSEKNQDLQFLIIDMLDFIKENDGVTRQEMSDWWNNKVMSE